MLSVAFCLLVMSLGCSSGGIKTTTSTVTSSTTTSSTSSTITTTTSVGNLTAAQVGNAGRTIFNVNCAACHGASGQGITGPALIGPNQSLNKYRTAQGLLDYIDTAMPLNAPGSLSSQQYLDVVVYLLVQNNWLSGTTIVNNINLSGIQLK